MRKPVYLHLNPVTSNNTVFYKLQEVLLVILLDNDLPYHVGDQRHLDGHDQDRDVNDRKSG